MKQIIFAFLLACPQGFSAIARIGHTAVQGSSPTTPTINCTGATLLVVTIMMNFGTGVSAGDAGGNTYHALTTYSDGANINSIVQFYAFDKAGGGMASLGAINWSTPGANLSLFAACYSGSLTTASVFDLSTGAGSSTVPSTWQPGSLTPTANGDLLVTGIVPGDGTAYTIDSGFSITDQNSGITNQTGAMADLVQGAAAAVNPTWTGTSTSRKAAAMAAFKSAAAPPSANTMPPSVF